MSAFVLAAHKRMLGLSLIEVLVAIVVLGFGASGVVALFVSASATHRRSVDRTRSALVAEQVFATAEFQYRLAMEPDELVKVVLERLPSPVGNYAYEIVAFRPVGDEWAQSEIYIQVEVRWKRSGRTRSERFATIVLPRGRSVGEQVRESSASRGN